MSPAAPCLDCGTTGGYVKPGRSRPTRVRGLCHTCEVRHGRAGTLDQYAPSRWPAGEAVEYLDAFLAGEIEPDANGCVRWPGATSGEGYATMRAGGGMALVGRLVAEHRFGPPPSPEHSQRHAAHDVCGNTDCIEHVVGWATPPEQLEDQRRDGTMLRGERGPGAKLTEADALEVRHGVRCLGEPQRAVAAAFGVTQRAVGKLARSETWSHLAEIPCPHCHPGARA